MEISVNFRTKENEKKLADLKLNTIVMYHPFESSFFELHE
jgi:hypothetical protein